MTYVNNVLLAVSFLRDNVQAHNAVRRLFYVIGNIAQKNEQKNTDGETKTEKEYSKKPCLPRGAIVKVVRWAVVNYTVDNIRLFAVT